MSTEMRTTSGRRFLILVGGVIGTALEERARMVATFFALNIGRFAVVYENSQARCFRALAQRQADRRVPGLALLLLVTVGCERAKNFGRFVRHADRYPPMVIRKGA